MIKKAAFAAVLAVSSSFAAWDLFPVQDAGKGEVKLSYANYFSEYGGFGRVALGARYTVINNLELALTLPYYPYDYDDEGNFHSFADGVGNLMAMARYQFLPNVNGLLDVTFPVGNESVVGHDEEFRFHFGAQYSQKFGMVNFGSELGLVMETYGNDGMTAPWVLNALVEGDFETGSMFVPFAKLGFVMELGGFSFDNGRHTGPHTGHFGISPTVGVDINVTDHFSLELLGDVQTQWHGDDFSDPIYMLGVNASYKF